MYKNRRKIASTTLHKRAARAKIEFCVPGRDLASILAAPERSRVFWTLLLASRAALEDPLGDPGACWERPEMLPRRFWDAFRMILGTTGRPERVQGTTLSRFGVPEYLSQDQLLR